MICSTLLHWKHSFPKPEKNQFSPSFSQLPLSKLCWQEYGIGRLWQLEVNRLLWAFTFTLAWIRSLPLKPRNRTHKINYKCSFLPHPLVLLENLTRNPGLSPKKMLGKNSLSVWWTIIILDLMLKKLRFPNSLPTTATIL